MNRRSFLKSILFLCLLSTGSLTGCSSLPKPTEPIGLAIVQGVTGATSTQIAVVASPEIALDFFVSDSAQSTSMKQVSATAVSPIQKKSTDAVVYHVHLDSLKPGATYSLEIREASAVGVHARNPGAGRVIDRRQFRTLDVSARPARVIAASCMYDIYVAESKAMWKSVLDAKPELILLIGDNVYAEVKNGRFPSPLDEAALWTRYTETFRALDFYRIQELIPTLVTWDDHDYGMKDGNLENPHKLVSKRVLETFFAQSASPMVPEYTKGPGVSSKFDAFGYRFLLLDDRSFRTPFETAPDKQSHFGDEQEKWIQSQVYESKTPVWLISGDQWFGAYHRFDSYEGRHPESFKRFFKMLRNSPVGLMFISGDRHMSEINRIESSLLGYETFEFTSSSLHSKMHVANWDTIPNHRQVRGIDMRHNYTLFDLVPEQPNGTLRLKGESRGQESVVHYSFDFEVKRSSSKRTRR